MTDTSKALRQVGELLALDRDDWDSYGATRISRVAIRNALKFVIHLLGIGVLLPDLVPTNDGGVQLEWHTRGIDLELDVITDVRVLIHYEHDGVVGGYECINFDDVPWEYWWQLKTEQGDT